MNKQQEEYLKTICQRVNFDRTERTLYGHDIAAIPNLIKPLVGDTTPDVVVQPQSEEELVEIVRWSYQKGIPLTPRGKASSGYGGVIPLKRGVVVDFYFLKDVIAIDPSEQIVTVQPGITWEQLDKALKPQGLTLRLYPTSYPSSSVGGWLAQGGAGIGSYQFGFISDNVIKAQVVLPNGEVQEFNGDDLELISEAEGITGFISQVTLQVQPLEGMEVISLACPTAHDLQSLVEAMISAELPIWSMMFINPRMAEMKNRAPLREHHGHPAEERVILPAAYVLTMTFRASEAKKIHTVLPEILEDRQVEILSDRISQHEWENRFKIMIVKRLGPSLVPAEIIVPLSHLGEVMGEIERKVNQPVIKEAVIIGNGREGEPEVAILGFIPSDQRKFSYNFVFGLALTIMKIAEKFGGRPYSTGMYFTKRADQVLGKAKAQSLRAYKAQIDPKGLLNPGKVVSNGLLEIALNLAMNFEPMIRPFGNTVITQVGERPTRTVRDIPQHIAWYAYSCSQCGYCIDECDQFYGRGWESQSPRGKWYWLREYMEGKVDWNQKAVDTFLACTTCELCNLRCSAVLPIESSWMDMRGLLVDEEKEMTFPPLELMGAALHKEGDIWAGYRKDRDKWFPQDLLEKHGPQHQSKNIYFAGCTASYVENDIAIASVRVLDEADVDFTYLGEKENCCATPMLVAGKWDLFVETMKKNIQTVKEAGADTVMTSCPACDMMWRQVYPRWAEKLDLEYGITTRHYSELVSEKIKSGEFHFPGNHHAPTKVTWHDSCHIGRVSGVYEPPRDLIKSIPNVEFVEMQNNRQSAHCCGSVVTLIKEPEVAAQVGKFRLDEALEVGAEKVLSLCPCCEFQFRVSADKKDVPVQIEDLAHFSAAALGYDLPNPRPEVMAQWAVFEAMIELMTPEGFAALMDTMWPELMEAMPAGMGKMMYTMGKIPGALTLMKPMFPMLFPSLLPGMLPKVLPVMVDRIRERIDMPDYMSEQMPELLPSVMDNLMPHMIDEVVSLVTQPMIDYLQGNRDSVS